MSIIATKTMPTRCGWPVAGDRLRPMRTTSGIHPREHGIADADPCTIEEIPA